MKNTIRCCISCILPCGALDVIRIVHANGHVEEISGSIRACEILKAYPKHVLKKPSSPSESSEICPKIVIVSPEAELRRGKIYFLMPAAPPPSVPPEKKGKRSSRSSTKRKKKVVENNTKECSGTNFEVSDRYLSEILSENASMRRDHGRRGRSGVWRPHLESICETFE
ncbi:hypothetical protein LguiA_014915 [Lonicera macranthoides]